MLYFLGFYRQGLVNESILRYSTNAFLSKDSLDQIDYFTNAFLSKESLDQIDYVERMVLIGGIQFIWIIELQIRILPYETK